MNQIKCFEQRAATFKAEREKTLRMPPQYSRDCAMKVVEDAEKALRRAIECADYGEAETNLWRLMCAKNHLAAHLYGHLYREEADDEADDGLSTRHYESVETSVRDA